MDEDEFLFISDARRRTGCAREAMIPGTAEVGPSIPAIALASNALRRGAIERLVSIHADAPITCAFALMEASGVDRLAVVDADGVQVGVLFRREVLELISAVAARRRGRSVPG